MSRHARQAPPPEYLTTTANLTPYRFDSAAEAFEAVLAAIARGDGDPREWARKVLSQYGAESRNNIEAEIDEAYEDGQKGALDDLDIHGLRDLSQFTEIEEIEVTCTKCDEAHKVALKDFDIVAFEN